MKGHYLCDDITCTNHLEAMEIWGDNQILVTQQSYQIYFDYEGMIAMNTLTLLCL